MFRVLAGVVLMVVLSITLQGCSRGTGATPPTGDASTADPGPAAVTWPAVADLPRGVAATGPVITGAEYLSEVMTAQNVSIDGDAAVFASSAPAPATGDTLACALYGVDFSDWRGGVLLDFSVDTWDDTGECWLALANRRLECWDWRSVDPRESCAIVELAHYLDSADQLFFVVVMATESAVSLDQLTFGSEPPVAVLTTNPAKTGGEAPLMIGFNASASTWYGGPPADYQWDFDGDWVFNEADNGELAAQGNASPIHEYITARTVEAHLLVLGGLGVGRYASVTIAPARIAHPVLTEAEYPLSIIIVAGTPLLCYCDLVGDDFRLCLERGDGAGGWLPVEVLGTYNIPFKQPTLRIINGKPAVAYALDHSPDGAIYYMAAIDTTGSSWNPPVQAGLNWGTSGIELAEINGRPALCWLDDNEGNDLVYARANDATGTTWGTPVLIAEDVMRHISMSAKSYSLAVVDGMPAVAYHDFHYNSADDRLMYCRATAADGSAWGTPLEIDGVAEKEPGYEPTLTVCDGVPAITYTAGIFQGFLILSDIRYVRAQDATGTAWDAPIVLEELPINDYRCEYEIGDLTGYCVAYDTFTTGAGDADRWETRCLQLKDGELNSLWCILRGPDGEWSRLYNLTGPYSEVLHAKHFRIRTEEFQTGVGPLARNIVNYYVECYMRIVKTDGPEVRLVERLVHTDCFVD